MCYLFEYINGKQLNDHDFWKFYLYIFDDNDGDDQDNAELKILKSDDL